MRALAVSAWLAMAPLQALAQTSDQDCQSALDGFAVVGSAFKVDVGALQGAAVTGGWCRITTTAGPPVGLRFDSARFRLDGLDVALPDSRSLEIEVTGLQTVFGRFDVTAALSHQSTTDLLTVHSATAGGADGRGARAQARLTMSAFATADAATDAIAALQLDTGTFQIILTPDFLNETGADFSGISRVAVDDALAGVSQSQVSTQSRNEFLRFAGAVPNARGTLDVALSAPDGIGIVQFAAPLLALDARPDDQAIAQALAVALTGIVLDVAWKPGRM